LSKINNTFGRLLAWTSRFNVDALVRGVQQNIVALENTQASLNARANKQYTRAAELEKRGDIDSTNAARAARVAAKLKALVD
jgi:hypothetical protein